MLSIIEISIRAPDPFEHLDGQGQGLDGTDEAEPRVSPTLSEVTVHAIIHVHLRYGTHASNKHICSHHGGGSWRKNQISSLLKSKKFHEHRLDSGFAYRQIGDTLVGTYLYLVVKIKSNKVFSLFYS